MQWWGPNDFTTPVYNMDLRVGGKFLICKKSPGGDEYWNAGVYHEIIPRQKIVLSMYFADKEGNQVTPEHYGIEHEAIPEARDTVLLEDRGDGRTKLTFIGNESREEAEKSGQVEGWNQILDKFAAVLAGLAQPESQLGLYPGATIGGNQGVQRTGQQTATKLR